MPYAGIMWSQALLSFVQYAFHPGEVTEQVGKLFFSVSFEPKIRLVRVCSISVISCLQARVCTVCISALSQVTFAAVLLIVLLTLRHRNSSWAKHRHRVPISRPCLIARITCMFPCLCAQGSSIAEYSLVAVKRDTCVLVCLYALRGFTRPSYISGGGGGVGFLDAWGLCRISDPTAIERAHAPLIPLQPRTSAQLSDHRTVAAAPAADLWAQ